MKIFLREIPVRDIASGYTDNEEEGVTGLNGKLNIRPKYQREFVYKPDKRNAVISTAYRLFPLNVMYWAVNPDGTYEVLDGQQRTISLCQYVSGDFPIALDNHPMFFHNLTKEQQNRLLDYKCMVYLCEGTDKEKLDWFETINIAGEPLTQQELRNAVYTGDWLTHAKSIFSKSNCAAYNLGKDYVSGDLLRQYVLATAISWVSNGDIEQYMAAHQNAADANEVWKHFQAVIKWTKATFPNRSKQMKGVDWGRLYRSYKDIDYDVVKLGQQVAKLMSDDDVSNKKGIYDYVLSGDESALNVRGFSDSQKVSAYERQQHMCLGWRKEPHGPFSIEAMHADHITPWHKGGKTVPENCQMLCASCNRRKSGI